MGKAADAFEELFPSMFKTRPEDVELFGDAYCGKPEQKYGEWVTVARYPKSEGDGLDAEIDECRMPAQFYRVRVLDGTNSIGELKTGFTLGTGSGREMAKLVIEIAKAASQGMLGNHDE